MNEAKDNELQGRHVAISGANTGIGRVAALDLARRGAVLTLLGRSEARTRPVLDEIAALPGAATPAFVAVDLSDLTQIAPAAAAVRARGPLAVLINNAGVAGPRQLSPQGFEPAFATNHLGPFLLTELLLDDLRAGAPARIVNVASRAHERVHTFDFEALQKPPKSRTGFYEYSVSKLCNVLHTKELARRLAGSNVTTYCLHPGVVATDIWRRVPGPARAVMKLFMISPEDGARVTIRCATAPLSELQSGGYYDPNGPRRVSRLGDDEPLARRLWEQSAKWTDAFRG